MILRLILIASVGISSLASADSLAPPTTSAALVHFKRGTDLFGIKEFRDAITEYKAGAMIEHSPVFDFSLGQCYRALDQPDDALWYYRRFLKSGHPTGKVLEGVNNLISALEHDHERPLKPLPPPVVVAVPPVTVLPPPRQSSPLPREVRQLWYKDRVAMVLSGSGMLVLGASGYIILTGRSLHNESNVALSEMQRVRLQQQALGRYQLGAVAGALGLGLVLGGTIKLTFYPASVAVSGQF